MANNLVTIPRDKLQEIGEKMTENKILKGTVETQNTTIKNLTKENKELKKEIKKIQEDNKAKEQDMKKKFMEFHSEQKKMQSELEKYQAVPEFKGILDLYSELLDFRKQVDNVFKNDPMHQQRRKLDKKIEEYKQKNLELETELRKNGAKITTKVRANDLQEAENKLKKVKDQTQMNYVANKAKVNEMTAKMKSSTTKLVGTITNALAEINKHLVGYKVDLENIRKSSSEFVDKPIYDAIMNILLEQQNALMKNMIETSGKISFYYIFKIILCYII